MFAIVQEQYMDHRIWADQRLTETVQHGMQVFFQMDDEPMDIRSYAMLDLKLCMIEERQEVLPQLEILKAEYPRIMKRSGNSRNSFKMERTWDI